ncbi:hypothetical protein FJT64_015553 [Amphibalanus amphitrite]|uniref:Mab-21-like HhH/H2TH-like domain-containing protein n=1 Tax=Amphibalanus amphitrite TaxID=1232801 RepID=A0A6A4XGI6_AMPAM|nr:hypothetical protein FJT64_015553 [Amphibalanus amphitrite]
MRELYSLCRQALIASADERIAALTRVLEAPDDDPAEMAAARAALARSKAYPQLEEWRPIEEVSTRETYRSILGGGVLPSEEACALALYRDLLNGGGPGEADCSTSTGEDILDKEVLRYELEAQKIYKQYYSERVSDEFVNRERPSGQPNKALVKKLSEMPIYLVGKDGKFRMSFSRLESEVIRSMTKPQRICLVLLKHCAAVTGEGSSMFIEKYMCSYDLKTAMMWVCERRAPELWTWDGMLESMRAVVDFLLERVEPFYLPCYFSPQINLWKRAEQSSIGLEVFRLRSLLPRGIQLLLAGLLSSSQAPLMRHLLNLPLDAQQMLWCCWKRRVDDPHPTGPGSDQKWEIRQQGLCCLLYPAAVEGRLWSEEFLDTFRWESLPARCRQPDWFAEHGWDSDSEGEEENEKDTDREGEEENRKDTDSEGEEENRKDKERERERRRTEKTRREREGEEENRKDKKREG